MDELYGLILAFRARLRELGRGDDGRELLEALTNACGPREILDNVRMALADLPRDLPADLLALQTQLEDLTERLWQELPGPER